MLQMTEKTISVQLTNQELFDIRIALMDYRSKWFDLYHKGLQGEMPQNFDVKGAELVYQGILKLQERIIYFSENFND
jgi:hypothetical protein